MPTRRPPGPPGRTIATPTSPECAIETASGGIVEKSYRPGESIFVRGDHFEYWTGVVSGLVRRFGALHVAAGALVLASIPKLLMGLPLPAVAVAAVLVLQGFFGPLTGAPRRLG